jgi:hypothetical protein
MCAWTRQGKASKLGADQGEAVHLGRSLEAIMWDHSKLVRSFKHVAINETRQDNLANRSTNIGIIGTLGWPGSNTAHKTSCRYQDYEGIVMKKLV